MVNKYYENTMKSFEKKHMKDTKLFLKKKKKKSVSITVNVIRIFLKNKKKKKVE